MLDSGFTFVLKPKTEKLNLGEEQVAALKALEEFTTSKDSCISLVGSAGTGKTSIIKEYLEYLDDSDIPYVLAAPTHRAKLVLESLTGTDEAYTVHQLLSLAPDIAIFELDYRELLFKVADSFHNSTIPYKGVAIIDEASMIGDDLFKLLLEKCEEFKCKIVFVGDARQLRPVKSDTISKVFTLPNKVELTKIYRQKQDSPVTDVLSVLRNKALNKFETSIGNEDAFIVNNTTKDFLLNARPYLQKTVKDRNVLNCKILAYTNARVNAYNEIARKLVFDDISNPFNVNEILCGTDNFDYNGDKFYNSLDYIVDSVEEHFIMVPHIRVYLKGWHLKLYDTVYKGYLDVFVTTQNDNNSDMLTALGKIIEKIRIEALLAKQAGNRRVASRLWKQYFEIINSFATTYNLYFENRVIKKKTFDYGYAITVHRSQGTTLNTVFVDIGNISKANPEEIQQLQYVAISRTRGNAYILI